MNDQQRIDLERGSRPRWHNVAAAIFVSVAAVVVIAVFFSLALTSMLGPPESELVDWPMVERTIDGTVTTPMPEDMP